MNSNLSRGTANATLHLFVTMPGATERADGLARKGVAAHLCRRHDELKSREQKENLTRARRRGRPDGASSPLAGPPYP